MSWRRIILNVLLVLIPTAAIILWNNPAWLPWAPKPCEKPISYSIGTFDPRFGISNQDFLGAITEAESVWEKASGKDLFAYAPGKATLPINLIYDYRQETTQKLSNIETSVTADESQYESLKAKYESLKNQYEAARQAYESHVSSFNQKSSDYQAQVDAWNRSRRTSKETYNELQAAKAELESEAAALKTEEDHLHDMVTEINSMVGTLNSLAKSLNLKVDSYNTIGAARGDSYTGGQYSDINGEQKIDIYEFSNHEKLVRIIAHELGHALGLNHVDDPNAIMYYLNEGNTEAPTAADMAALNALCGAN